jgi:hypothetical protein
MNAETISRLSPSEWQRAVIQHNIRRKFHFLALGVLDRGTSGKGLNKEDYYRALKESLGTDISFMPAESLKDWVLTFCKYRERIARIGCMFPEYLFEGDEV